MTKQRKFPHGTVNGYTNLGCRCEKCRAAWARAHKDYLDRHPEQREKARQRERVRRGRPAEMPWRAKPRAVHGEASGWRKHKREHTNFCGPCRKVDASRRRDIDARRKLRNKRRARA
jgi:hypothetical protein